MKGYTFGIDIGTTSICALAYDTENDRLLHAINRANTSAIASPDAFARMQDTDVILKTASGLLDELETAFGMPSAIGVTGQMHGIVYLDVNGNAVSPLYTWQDARAAEEKENRESQVSFVAVHLTTILDNIPE